MMTAQYVSEEVVVMMLTSHGADVLARAILRADGEALLLHLPVIQLDSMLGLHVGVVSLGLGHIASGSRSSLDSSRSGRPRQHTCAAERSGRGQARCLSQDGRRNVGHGKKREEEEMMVKMGADEGEKVGFVTKPQKDGGGGRGGSRHGNSELPTSSAVGRNFRHTEKNKSKQTASARGLGLGGVGDKECANEVKGVGIFDWSSLYQMGPICSYLGQARTAKMTLLQNVGERA